jgi:anti-sigma factor ChrR (cupin superfamily)
MIDHAATHSMTDVAALYALGALSQHEARSFEEHLEEGCDGCSADLESFTQTVRALGFSATDEEPPASLRADLLARLEKSVSDSEEPIQEDTSKQFVSVLESEGEWCELQEGILLKRLFMDQATGLATSLVRMRPGTALPVHQHLGVEQFFVLEGDCNVAGQNLGAGDYHRAEAGSIHQTTYTVDGTLLLLIAPESYQVLDAR